MHNKVTNIVQNLERNDNMNGFIQSTINTPLTLASNSSAITFQHDRRTRSTQGCDGWLCHGEGSPVYKLVKSGNYKTTFTATVYSATAGTVAVGLYEDGVLIPETVRNVTLSAGYLGNISIDYISKVCCKANTSLTLASVPTLTNPADGTIVTTLTPTIISAVLNITRL